MYFTAASMQEVVVDWVEQLYEQCVRLLMQFGSGEERAQEIAQQTIAEVLGKCVRDQIEFNPENVIGRVLFRVNLRGTDAWRHDERERQKLERRSQSDIQNGVIRSDEGHDEDPDAPLDEEELTLCRDLAEELESLPEGECHELAIVLSEVDTQTAWKLMAWRNTNDDIDETLKSTRTTTAFLLLRAKLSAFAKHRQTKLADDFMLVRAAKMIVEFLDAVRACIDDLNAKRRKALRACIKAGSIRAVALLSLSEKEYDQPLTRAKEKIRETLARFRAHTEYVRLSLILRVVSDKL